jgi:catechol 2,3-dioxygenase-like lactoylglutathione lyase family enzyme
MRGDRITANLPSRDFSTTEAFYAALGFAALYKSDEWMILTRGPLMVEFFHHPDVDPLTSWFSACIRVDDLDSLYADFLAADLPEDDRTKLRLSPPEKRPGIPRMFALVDADGSLLRCLQNGPD